MNHCRRYVVVGRVQGVFYRASAQDTARRLGLSGWVCNRNDGRVELVACGDPERLQELERWLWRGPAHAQVQEVSCEDVEDPGYTKFVVR